MPRITRLDKQWQQLMALCESESKFRSEGSHSKLLKLVASDIEALAAEMGFSAHRIATRDFRAERDGHHIVGIVATSIDAAALSSRCCCSSARAGLPPRRSACSI